MNMANAEVGDDKKKALTIALSQIEKQFGKGSVMKMGDQTIAKIGNSKYGFVGSRYCAGSRRITLWSSC